MNLAYLAVRIFAHVMSSREAGQGFNWRQLLIIGAPIALSIAAVATIYIYYSRKKRKEKGLEINTDDVRKDKKTSGPRPLTPSPENEEVIIETNYPPQWLSP